MKLKDLLNTLSDKNTFFYNTNKLFQEIEVKSITCDSRKVCDGTLFFVKGVNFKKDYLQQAILAGAVAYVAEEDFNMPIPLIKVENIRRAMPLFAKAFYENPSSEYKLAGITGTKGKTTCVYMLKNIFTEFFEQNHVGLISTNEALCGEKSIPKNGSTPEALELYEILNIFKKENIKAACMEVSSQGLQYNRVDGVDFFIGGYLNLAPDHISPTEHKSFEEYKSAKKRMLTLCKNGVVNIDDKYAEEIIAAASCEKIYTVSSKKNANFEAREIILTKKGISFKVFGNYINNVAFELKMPGQFNVNNALVAIACAYISGCDIKSIQAGLLKTKIEGRMEVYESDITVIVDYAHNQMSFEAVFQHVEKFYPKSKIICMFGCPGNKAYDRRTEIPEAVGKYADFAIITSDDPENEDPQAIFSQLETELNKTHVPHITIENREHAIQYALSHAKKGDVVFLAGKGHETTQKVKGKYINYKGDMPCAMEIMKERK